MKRFRILTSQKVLQRVECIIEAETKKEALEKFEEYDFFNETILDAETLERDILEFEITPMDKKSNFWTSLREV